MAKPFRARRSSTTFVRVLDELTITPGRSATVARGNGSATTIVICTWTDPEVTGNAWTAHLTIQAQSSALQVRLDTSEGMTHVRWLDGAYAAIDAIPSGDCRLNLFAEEENFGPGKLPVLGSTSPGTFELASASARGRSGKKFRWEGRSGRTVAWQVQREKLWVRVTSRRKQDTHGLFPMHNPVTWSENPEPLLCPMVWDEVEKIAFGYLALSLGQPREGRGRTPDPDEPVIPLSELASFSEDERNASFDAVLDTGKPVLIRAWVNMCEQSSPEVWDAMIRHLEALVAKPSQRRNVLTDLYGPRLEGLTDA